VSPPRGSTRRTRRPRSTDGTSPPANVGEAGSTLETPRAGQGSDEASGSERTPASAPLLVRVAVWIGALAVGAVAALLFMLALPDAVARAKEGVRRDRELPCEELKPTSVSDRLGRFPVAAPDFALKDFTGRELKLSQFRGQVVLVNFWATWCSTCAVEMPSMERLVERMKGRPFRLLALSVDDGWEPIRNFFPQGTPLEILLDSDRKTSQAFGTEKFPESFLVDPEGNIRYFVVSDRDWSRPEVAACIESMMQ
jgi:peroxiredoxin